MSDAERRYDDDEVREILTRATEVWPESEEPRDDLALPEPPSDQGLTLAELEVIGRKAGIPTSRMTEAVAEIDAARSLGSGAGTHMGVVLGAAHEVRLPRLLTDDEWDQFVVRLRKTFDSGGTVTSEGSLRSWTGGGVEVWLEPLPDGGRLRFESTAMSAKSVVDAGVALLVSGGVLAGVFGVLGTIVGKPIPGVLMFSLLAMLGLGGGFWGLGRHSASTIRAARATDFSRLGTEVRRIASTPAT